MSESVLLDIDDKLLLLTPQQVEDNITRLEKQLRIWKAILKALQPEEPVKERDLPMAELVDEEDVFKKGVQQQFDNYLDEQGEEKPPTRAAQIAEARR